MLHGRAAENYNNSGPGACDYVAQCDLRACTIQSIEALPVGTEDFKVYDWNAPAWIRQNNQMVFNRMDDDGITEQGSYAILKSDFITQSVWESGAQQYFLNLGEGIRPRSFIVSSGWGQR